MGGALTALEQVKAGIDPYNGREVFARLARGTVADITPEDDVVMRWHGLYRHRPTEDGRFMLRLKLPGGAIAAGQLAAVADIAAGIDQDHVSLTTRQDIELHGLALADLPDVLGALAAVGLTTLGACGDQVRNVVACPVADLDSDAIADTTDVAQALTAAFLANAAFANLPRKLKVAVTGCAQGCVPADINDVALVAVPGADGYALLVGGGLSTQPARAADLGVLVTPEQVVTVVQAIAGIFRDDGARENRGHARLKHLLAARGLDWFRGELDARLPFALPALEAPLPPLHGSDHLGVHRQARGGHVYIGVPVPVGRLTVPQVRTLAGLGTHVRLTHGQNVVLADITEAGAPAVLVALAAAGLPADAGSWRGRVVSCTGKAFCNRALVHTKDAAARLVPELDALAPVDGISLRVSGCPNGCGQHAVADIGLQGALTDGEERFDLWVGGGDGRAFGRRVVARLRPDDVAPLVARWLADYRAGGDAGEAFSAWARRTIGATP